MLFRIGAEPLELAALRGALSDPSCGGFTIFEGRVRDLNEGRSVTRLEYESFEPLALKEGGRILSEAVERYGISRALCVHRTGTLQIGDLAVWVGVGARHRGETFDACRYIIEAVKQRLPIWKKEYYEDGDSGWVSCEQCAAAAAHTHTHG